MYSTPLPSQAILHTVSFQTECRMSLLCREIFKSFPTYSYENSPSLQCPTTRPPPSACPAALALAYSATTALASSVVLSHLRHSPSSGLWLSFPLFERHFFQPNPQFAASFSSEFCSCSALPERVFLDVRVLKSNHPRPALIIPFTWYIFSS